MSSWKPSTLADVAREAGVSPYTVSAVLNGARSNTRVSVATKQRILESAARLRYHPNAQARSPWALSRKTTSSEWMEVHRLRNRPARYPPRHDETHCTTISQTGVCASMVANSRMMTPSITVLESNTWR